MIKTAIITDEITQDLQAAAEIAARYMLDGLELRTVWDKGFHQLDEGEIATIQNICREHNLEICAVSSPFYKCGQNQNDIQEHLQILEKTIRNAQLLNCQIIRGFSFWSNGEFTQKLPEIASAFKEPAHMVQQQGMVLALEMDPTVNACNGEMLARLVEAINHPSVKVLWDPGNDIYAPVAECPFPDGYQQVKTHIAHVHGKDAVIKNGQPESVKLGTGTVQWEQQIAALLEDGYSGYISLEPHYRKGSTLSDELLRRPGGAEFSMNGEPAAIECIESLHQMLSRLQ